MDDWDDSTIVFTITNSDDFAPLTLTKLFVRNNYPFPSTNFALLRSPISTYLNGFGIMDRKLFNSLTSHFHSFDREIAEQYIYVPESFEEPLIPIENLGKVLIQQGDSKPLRTNDMIILPPGSTLTYKLSFDIASREKRLLVDSILNHEAMLMQNQFDSLRKIQKMDSLNGLKEFVMIEVPFQDQDISAGFQKQYLTKYFKEVLSEDSLARRQRLEVVTRKELIIQQATELIKKTSRIVFHFHSKRFSEVVVEEREYKDK